VTCIEKTRARAVSKKERRAWFFKAQGGRCCHCRGLMTMEGDGPLFATFEHLVPRNGKRPRHHNAHNTLLAHKTCNERRGQAPVSDALFKRANELWDEYFAWRAISGGVRPDKVGDE
jgi:hypothetical protein